MEDPAPPPPPALRLLLGAFGDPGHAFPMIGLGRELVARGHDVSMQTWGRWQSVVEGEGMRFSAAPEYHVFPNKPRPLKPYEAVVRAADAMGPGLGELAPHAVVADILTLGPALAAERAELPVATLVPHVYPVGAPGLPIFSFGARLPRGPLGRAFWRRFERLADRGLEQGRGELNETRRRLGLTPLAHFHGGLSRSLVLVAGFPALEYPRVWPQHVHVVGPILWEPPAEDVRLPPGEDPLVLIAPSTSQDPEHKLLRAALAGLADAPVRVLAVCPKPPKLSLPRPANASIVPWASYSRTMPHCAAVVCHAGYGTLGHALRAGCPVVACPGGGDMNESAARLDWAGVGVRVPPRYIRPRPLRRAVEKALADQGLRRRAKALAYWSRHHDPAARAADLVEELARADAPTAGVSPRPLPPGADRPAAPAR